MQFYINMFKFLLIFLFYFVSKARTIDLKELNEVEFQNYHIELNRNNCDQDTASHENNFCSQVFDGILCWNRTRAGSTAYQACPTFVIGFVNTQKARASRVCLVTGEWDMRRDENGLVTTNRTYTDYTQCLQPDNDDLLLRTHLPRIKLLAKIGCSISLVSLVVALTLMLFLKRLHCPRNILHVNLFASFLMFSIITLVKEIVMESVGFTDTNYFSNNSPVISNSSYWQCKLLVSLHRYFESNNHVMIFCEALYLNTLVMYTTFNEIKYYKFYVIGGWFAPFLWVVPYISVMAKFTKDNSCWSNETVYSYIYLVPFVLIILANFSLFINIMRILVLKMKLNGHSSLNGHNHSQKGFFHSRHRRLAKSTLILIPLFNIYYTIFSVWQPFFKRGISIELELLRLYFEIVCASLQGFAISMIYCFTNTEVRAELIKIVERKLLQRNPNMRRFSSISYNARKHSSLQEQQRRSNALMKYNMSMVTMKSDLDPDVVAVDATISTKTSLISNEAKKTNYSKPQNKQSQNLKKKFKNCCLRKEINHDQVYVSRRNSADLTNYSNTMQTSTTTTITNEDSSLMETIPLKRVLSELSFKYIDEDIDSMIENEATM